MYFAEATCKGDKWWNKKCNKKIRELNIAILQLFFLIDFDFAQIWENTVKFFSPFQALSRHPYILQKVGVIDLNILES